MIDVLLPASGTPRPSDPMYPLTQGKPKALLPIAGKPMVQWVLDALSGTTTIRSVTMVGVNPADYKLQCEKPLHFAPNAGSLMNNLLAGARAIRARYPDCEYGVLVSADIPAVTTEAIDWLVNTAMQTRDDGYYAVIRRADMERKFPNARRTYFKAKNIEFAANDINIVAARLADDLPPQFKALVEARKNPFKQASIIGFDLLWRFAFRQITLEEGAALIGKRLGIRGRAIISPYPEGGMDVDKPVQYDVLNAYLNGLNHGDTETRRKA